MIFKLLLVCLMALGAIGADYYTPESEQYLLGGLNSLLNPLVGDLLFDGPVSISNARTPKNKNKLPTLEQMNYYMYYAGSTYYGYELHDLSCEYCQKFRDDVCDHEVLSDIGDDTLALVTLSKKRKEIVVSFRGTWNVWNVVLDLLTICGSNRTNKIRIHQGFYIATMSLYDDVVLQIAEYLIDFRDYKVVLLGHSLGAAMARLTTFFLIDNNLFPHTEYELYTYGEPRVGNKCFADFFNSLPIKTARVTARADIVPHLPPTSVLGTKLLGDYYVHCQTEFWINGKKNQKFCRPTLAEDPTCSMSMGPIYTAVDHLIYFDVNVIGVCGQPLIFAYLPLGLLDPVAVLPPLPKPIQNLLGPLAQGLVGGISPLLG